MAEEVFTDPDATDGDCVDVRMIDAEEEEWDIDVIVVEGRFEYVDLRI